MNDISAAGHPQKFSCREAKQLTDASKGRIAHFEKLGMISPERMVDGNITKTVFSWGDIFVLKAYAAIREYASPIVSRKISKFLRECEYSDLLEERLILISGDDVFWLTPDLSGFKQFYAFMATWKDISTAKNFRLVNSSHLAEIAENLNKSIEDIRRPES